jgi:DNA-binding FadR family transcriptional regulator
MTQVTKESDGVYQPGYEMIAAKIVELIKTTNLQPGDRLPTEQNLAERLNVSRTMVREAVKILTAGGYVRTRRGSGIYVNAASPPFATAAINFSVPIDPEQMRALFEFRSMQEMLTARLATERITVVELRALEKVLALNQQAAENMQWDLFIESDDAFHHGIAAASHNLFLAETIATVLRLQRWSVRIATGGAPGSLLASAEQHHTIFAAIQNGVPEATAQAMKTHIESVHQAYMQDVRRRLLAEDIEPQ